MRRRVPVHHLQWHAVHVLLFVGCMQTAERIDHDAKSDPRGKSDPLRPQLLTKLTQAHALDVVHHQQLLARGFVHVEDSDDVGVVDERRDPRFIPEHRGELLAFRDVWMHSLDRDDPLKPAGAELPAHVDGRHAPRGDGGEQLVTRSGARIGDTSGLVLRDHQNLRRTVAALGVTATSACLPSSHLTANSPSAAVVTPAAAVRPRRMFVRRCAETPSS